MDSYICTSSQNNNAIAAKLHIEDIRKRKFSIGESRPNPLTEDLQNAVANLSSELYTKDVHFLMELIQVSLFLKSLCVREEVCFGLWKLFYFDDEMFGTVGLFVLG